MRLSKKLCFTVFLTALISHAQAQNRSTLVRQLDAVCANMPHASTKLSVCVVDLNTGSTVFAKQADTPLVPASTMKLFTMAAAVDILGADFEFITRFAFDSNHLYVIGDGDPCIGDERLARLHEQDHRRPFQDIIAALKTKGVSHIPGYLILDDAVLDRNYLHPAWESGDHGKWYAAPVGAFNLNDNCLEITLTPGAKNGSPPVIDYWPRFHSIEFVNKARTGSGKNPVVYHPPGTQKYIISGRCSKTWPFGPVAVENPAVVFGEALHTALAEAVIEVERGVAFVDQAGIGPIDLSRATVLATQKHALGDALLRIGKNSQNLFAEAVFKRMGHAFAQREHRLVDGSPEPGSWENGQEAVLSFLDRVLKDTKNLSISDGSGLSRENQCSSRHLVSLLQFAHGNPAFGMFMDGLAISGVDGSMRKRLRDDPNRVIGKTGTMRGICSLAGYVLDEQGHRRFAFSVIFNGYKGGSAPYRKIQDRICERLIAATDR
ncbi:MAG: D-alanyl-D-alanine carboxypeptidase/D-alanyl-D-alanine endopeptidase [Planctomycetota bacterium]|jgi:D-alanyl-D-alanine carboxypeptidase/D-alanyl-D-alanine-endopeptidase (penicillin-binding protein 4)